MLFTKMHGAGNDYIYVDCFAHQTPESPSQLAVKMSDRRYGVGGDGLILIEPSDLADARMRMFNADGSEAEICGNGIRCVAKYVYDHDICHREQLRIDHNDSASLHVNGALLLQRLEGACRHLPGRSSDPDLRCMPERTPPTGATVPETLQSAWAQRIGPPSTIARRSCRRAQLSSSASA